jgi:hypothetical protein
MFFNKPKPVAPTSNLRCGSGYATANRQPLTDQTCAVSQGVTVRAHSINRHLVFVGLSEGQGVPLAAGESVLLPVDDPSQLFVWSGTTRKQTVSWFAI